MRLIGLAAAVMLSACAVAPTPRPSEEAFDAPPTEPEAKARTFIESKLRDPESARYRFGTLTKAYGAYGVWNNTLPWAGYLIPVDVNAKNGFGGYTGFKPYVVYFQMGEPIRAIEANRTSWKPY